jgi:tight adherence protein C
MALGLLIAAFFAAGVMMIAIALAQIASRTALMQERMRQAALPPGATTVAYRPFGERLMLALDDFLRRRTPAERIRRERERLVLAGRPVGLTVGRLLAIKAGIGIVATAGSVIFLLSTGSSPFGLGLFSIAIVAVVVGLVGYYIPDYFLRRAVTQHRDGIRRQLPEVCDLLSVCVDAGAPFDVALQRVVDSPYMAGPLVEELRATLLQIQLASGRLEALEAMADRLDVEDLRVFVTALGESFKRGTSIAETLRSQGDDIRERFREHAEERANQATIKMLIPLVFLIFPTLFLVILTPALIQVTNAVTGGQ